MRTTELLLLRCEIAMSLYHETSVRAPSAVRGDHLARFSTETASKAVDSFYKKFPT